MCFSFNQNLTSEQCEKSEQSSVIGSFLKTLEDNVLTINIFLENVILPFYQNIQGTKIKLSAENIPRI